MSGLWDQPGVPHKGWLFVGIDDLGRASSTCEMCRSQHIRYVHYMEHPDYPDQLGVGCVCAEKMSGDYTNPRLREKKIQSKAGRRSRWLTRNWRTARSGNPYLKVDGVLVVIFRFKQGRRSGKYGYKIGENFGDGSFNTEDEAKLAAFDDWWEAVHS